MLNATHQQKLILASQSPRRSYLLNQAGLEFDVIPSRFDEDRVPLTDPEGYVRTLAESKAEDVAKTHEQCWVIGADTIVLMDGAILGKPKSAEDARRMLCRLSGRVHQVLTGFAICCRAKDHLFSDVATTDVHFKDLSPNEVEWYIHTDEPFDKAGAYAIQGLGTFLVRQIKGSYTNVVGLPVCEVIEHLIRMGVVQYRV
ncbi:MAG: septum formation inhibitor Maf [Desulfobacterales bacterium]|nr:septum formation inhibitor Maf [Desulfobacterales bacterium]